MGRLLQPVLGCVFLEGAVGYVGSHQLPPTFGKSLDNKEGKSRLHCTRCSLGLIENTSMGQDEYSLCLFFGFVGYFFVVFSNPGLLRRKSFQMGPFQ